MKPLSIEQCQRDLAALEAADTLSEVLRSELENLESIDTETIIKKAGKMLLTRNFSLEQLGLNPELFNQVKTLEKISATARKKLRERILADMAKLENVQEVNHDESC